MQDTNNSGVPLFIRGFHMYLYVCSKLRFLTSIWFFPRSGKLPRNPVRGLGDDPIGRRYPDFHKVEELLHRQRVSQILTQEPPLASSCSAETCSSSLLQVQVASCGATGVHHRCNPHCQSLPYHRVCCQPVPNNRGRHAGLSSCPSRTSHACR